jgi:carbonic anhydrase/acetyltransferase-like protein (isoleucine patch superfamily)
MIPKRLTVGTVSLQAYRFWNRLFAKAFTVCCSGAFHRIGPRTVLQPPIRLGGENRIELGNRVFVGAGSWLEVIGPGSPDQTPVITISDETSIAGYCTITAAERVVIERQVLIARYVYISDHTHTHISRELAVKDQGISKVSPVRICEGAWLGQNVVVCPGVTIGRNAVVGANSVVRQDVPAFCVAAGSPAKIIRKVDATPIPAAGNSNFGR